MKLVTFNLRCCWNGDGINAFPNRAGGILEKIRMERPEILCFQEGIEASIRLLKGALPEYTFIFNQRNADYRGEGMATAFRKDAVDLLGLDCFWLSDTPHTAGSRFEEQSNCPRICQCMLLRANGTMFRVYNTHLDHVSDKARILGLQAIYKRMAEDRKILPLPVFLLGDFNAEPASDTIRSCSENALFPLVDLTQEIPASFHGFGVCESKIDYIYADRDYEKTVTAWDEMLNGVYLSDHYPLQVEFDL